MAKKTLSSKDIAKGVKLYRTTGGTVVYLHMKEPEQILKDKGFDRAGNAQQFHTANVLRRIKRYMPFVTGMTYKATIIHTDIRKPEIVTNVPYGKYLFYGKKMVNAKTGKGPMMIPGVGLRYKKGTVLRDIPIPLDYSKSKNRRVGPFWDRTLVAHEGKAIVADLQRYINSGR